MIVMSRASLLPQRVFTEMVTAGDDACMNIEDLWRSKLEELIMAAGGPTKLADELAAQTPDGEKIWSPNYLIQLRSPKKKFGKKTAQAMEKRAKKPAGWMNETERREEKTTIDRAVQADNDTIALQLAMSSLMISLMKNAPGAAEDFAAVLRHRADQMEFSTQTAGVVKEVLRTVELGQRRAAVAVQKALQHVAEHKAS